jgi:hypothetical protein
MTGFVVNGHERAVAGLKEQHQREMEALQAKLRACLLPLEREAILAAIERARHNHKAALAKLNRCLF